MDQSREAQVDDDNKRNPRADAGEQDGPSRSPSSQFRLQPESSAKGTSTFAFIDYPVTSHLFGVLLLINVLCVGMEIDYPWHGWTMVDAIFVLIYGVELGIRVAEHGWEFFLVPADDAPSPVLPLVYRIRFLSQLDVVIVVLGLLGVVLQFVPGASGLVRFFQASRLLRIARIFRLFESLAKFAKAVPALLQNLSWIFAVLVLVHYICALLIRIYVNDADDTLAGDGGESEFDDLLFGSVWVTMFSLFQVTTADGWMIIAEPLMTVNSSWRLFFMCFLAFCSWLMISVLTGVVSDTMIQETQNRLDFELEQKEDKRVRFMEFLRESFTAGDFDQNGLLDRQEFETLLNDDLVSLTMDELGVDLSKQELRRAFDMLDVDESGELTIDEFTLGLGQLQQSLTTKHVVSIDYALQRVQVKLSGMMDQVLADIEKSQKARSGLSTCLSAANRNMESIRDDIRRVKEDCRIASPPSPPPDRLLRLPSGSASPK